MKSKFFSLRLLVTLIAWLALLMPTAKLKADNNPLCFTAKNGSVTVRFDIKNVTHTIQYSTDKVNWSTYTYNTNVSLNANGKVYFRAETNQTTATAFGGSSSSSRFYFSSTDGGTVEASGNIMSLYGPDCPNIQLPQYAFSNLFSNCNLLTTAPVLSATTLAEWCYSYMFYGCTSLTTAPALPVTTLAKDCYCGMFRDCASLTEAPALPATTLAQSCYSSMFSGCTSLTIVPALPASILAEGCYYILCSMVARH